MKRTYVTIFVAAFVFAVVCGIAQARIKLTTLPERDKVYIKLDNPSYTLVEEERIVNLLKGNNDVDFSWANTNIIKDSIQFRCVAPPLSADSDVQVISVSYPPGENSLVWNVYSPASGPAKFRISYLITNLNRTVSYKAVAENDESSLLFRIYLKLANFSGEDFEDADIFVGYGSDFIKTIDNGESKQMLSDKFAGVPIVKTYTFDPSLYGDETVPMHYVIANAYKGDGMLGGYPLPYGKARIYQKDTRGGTAFLGEDWAQFTAVDDELKLYLGVARDIKVKKKAMKYDVINRIGNKYDTDEIYQYEVENFKDEAVTLDIVEHIQGEWEIKEVSTENYEKKDANTIVFHVDLPAQVKGEKVEKTIVTFHFSKKNIW